MKFTKPQDVLDAWNNHCYFTDGMKMAEFIDSLPAEFEIVEPGMTQVRWPAAVTKEALLANADYIGRRMASVTTERIVQELTWLAAIAPVEKKKQTAELWLHVSGQKLWKYPNDNWRLNSTGWRKVGECEVTE